MSLDDSHHDLVDDFLVAAKLTTAASVGAFLSVDCLDKSTELRTLLVRRSHHLSHSPTQPSL
jgi:hypothetical protein